MVNLNRYDFAPSSCILKSSILEHFDSELLVAKRQAFEIFVLHLVFVPLNPLLEHFDSELLVVKR